MPNEEVRIILIDQKNGGNCAVDPSNVLSILQIESISSVFDCRHHRKFRISGNITVL